MTLHKLADKIAFFLLKKKVIEQEKIEIYCFGLEVLIATVINGILVFAAALLLGVFWQTILLLIPFMLVRKTAGGFHAKTHIGCMLGFLFVFVFCVLTVKIIPIAFLSAISVSILIISSSVILKIGVLPHENRPVTEDELSGFIKKARLLTAILTALGMIGIYFWQEWFVFYTMGLFNASGSMLFVWINKNRKEKRHDRNQKICRKK